MADARLIDVYDGASGPVPVFAMEDDNGAPLDTTFCAMELRITDVDGVTIATLPGIPKAPRDSGLMYVYLKGKECDFGGNGGRIYAHPKIYTAVADDDTLAPNILLTTSFDADTNLDGIADDWTHAGGVGGVFDVGLDEPSPSVIYGKRQSVLQPGAGATDYLTQTRPLAVVAGDHVSGWVWHRAALAAGASVIGAGYYLEIPAIGGIGPLRSNFPVGNRDWSLVTVSGRVTTSDAAATINLVNYDAVGHRVVYDDARLFKGEIRVSTPEMYTITAKRRRRRGPGEVTELTAIVGGFERDSDGDGFPDGIANKAPGTNFSLDTTMVASPGSRQSLKGVLSGGTGKYLRIIERRRIAAGSTWEWRISYRTSGTLTGAPGAGTFGLGLSTEEFDGAVESAVSTNFLMNQSGSWGIATVSLTLAAEHNSLVLDINLNGASGTMWLDDAELRP